jgi:bifunctional non-homologous end joining protein LigD
LSAQFSSIVRGLEGLPDETTIDGEVAALDEEGRPSFNLVQNYGSACAPVVYYAFDVLMLRGKYITAEPLSRRRELLREEVLSGLSEPIRSSPELEASLRDLARSVRAQGLEGLIAKRRKLTFGRGGRF